MEGLMPLRYMVILLESAIKVTFGAVGDIDPPGLDDNAQIVDPLGVMLKKNFVWMKCQTCFMFQINTNDR